MRSGKSKVSGVSLMGLALGIAAGLAAGLLATPIRGREMRAKLRDRAASAGGRLQSLTASGRGWASLAADRSLVLLQEGRRSLETASRSAAATPTSLTATVGEITHMHGDRPAAREARS